MEQKELWSLSLHLHISSKGFLSTISSLAADSQSEQDGA